MNALSIDTATESLGLCLLANGQRRTLVVEAGLRHSEALLPGIRCLLDDAGIAPAALEAVACCVGPGSFTGIRIGLAAAKGLSFAARIPLIGVANLDALAFRFRGFPGVVVPVLAALRKNYYAALYRDGARISEYLALPLEELTAAVQTHPRVFLTGRGADALHRSLVAGAHRPGLEPILDRGGGSTDPVSLLELGLLQLAREGAPAGEPQPLYLRKSDAELSRPGGG